MKKMENEKKVRIVYATVIMTTLLFLTTSSILLANAAIPKQRNSFSMEYDSTNQKVILYGGDTTYGDAAPVGWNYDTWAFDYATNTWTKMEPATHPEGTFKSLAYDSESEKMIAWRGSISDHVVSNQTWIYDYSADTWTNAEPTGDPRLGLGSIEYDSESDIVIAHGGSLGKDYNPDGVPILINQTWAYDYNTNTWTNMTDPSHPIGRYYHKLAYDSESDRIIMFGGGARFDTVAEDPTGKTMGQGTWAYDYNTNTWENVSVNMNPEVRYGHSMAYDSESDRVILHGGYYYLNPKGLTDETWAFDYNTATWTQLNPEGDLERRGANMAYDAENDKIILFGGVDPDAQFTLLKEIWIFDYNANTWTQLTEDTSFSMISFLISLNLIVIAILLRRKLKK
ncbi:MAG: hypothetical protein H7645_05395 [Candidatus Heimdallarchaeota archaeon]|nr:hypothetical protein [Candidatus Heimdallarchaeota archaeon]MCK4769757.1 hypothetical protein [Candidatus Heimdallarchaeota archaeon]